MADHTNIEWCDSTFNPWLGCTRVSPACDDCYAARSTPARTLGVAWGPGEPRRRTSEANWKLPLRWNARPFYRCPECGWRGETDSNCPRCAADVMSARRRVFCASLADVFDNEVPPAWRADLFALIANTPELDWLLLTKRIGNARTMMADALHLVPAANREGMIWPLPNVWLGATICNQEEADRDIPKLLATPAAVRFLSIEPMLGPVDLAHIPLRLRPANFDGPDVSGYTEPLQRHGIGWVIVGGESGPKARPMHPDWVRSVRDQCVAAGVPFLFKQWGEWQEMDTGMPEPLVARYGDEEFYDEAAQHDAFLSHAGHFVESVEMMEDDVRYRGLLRIGKKAAGRQLDGRTHDEFPEVRND